MPLKLNPKGEVVVTSKLWKCDLADVTITKTKLVLFLLEERMKGVMEVYERRSKLNSRFAIISHHFNNS